MAQVIQVYEFDSLFLGKIYSCPDGTSVRFEKSHFDALLKYNELHGSKYFNPIYEGVKFKSYVGVVQIDDLTIEILPKIQRVDKAVDWRGVLIDMLRQTEQLRVDKINNAFVDHQNIHLLDIYFDWFLSEIESLLQRGLIKSYYTESKNTLALKGKLDFGKHIQHNFIHQERFFTTHQVYGTDHLFHQIIKVALDIVAKVSRGTYRFGRCKTVQLHFPEVTDTLISPKTFEQLSFSRKSEPYRTTMELARLIILDYAPNVKSGTENMLALLFNMNDLWEKFILVQLQRASKDWKVKGQESKRFWKTKSIRPDIVLEHIDSKKVFVIDTKWKHYSYDSISSHDLRQIFVYADYWSATGGMLLYPHHAGDDLPALSDTYHGKGYTAKIGLLSILNDTLTLRKDIGEQILLKLEN